MNLVKVNEIPYRRAKHDLRGFIQNFVNGEMDYAEVEFNDKDYVSSLSCYKCLFNAIKSMGYRAIVQVVKRGDEVYLARKTSIN